MDYYTVSAERNSFVPDASYYAQGYYQQMPPYTPAQGSQYASDAHPPPAYYSSYPAVSFPQQPVGYTGFLQAPFQPVEYPIQYSPAEVQPQIHAPIPISPYSTLIPSPTASNNHASTPRVNPNSENSDQIQSQPVATHPEQVGSVSPLNRYMNAPQVTFPTPCDILNDLAGGDQEGSETSDTPDITTPKPKAKTVKAPKDSEKPVENQRKAYFRGVSERVGFKLTDPDSITSHDKKRHNLECLERYVLWLHDQLRIVNQGPVAIERFSTANGLSSRSIRTLLVHMQIQIRKLFEEVEEERHMNTVLRDIMVANRLPMEGSDYRRHSIASGAIPALAASTLHN